ncbi:hypothetical protein Tsp_10010 [Trichinella spiralis]|uniref:hypothetical protein n=1 Tax=Trichinella spiralis TaxID=6334 RepID=UPI0001EFCD24|nr:hypothetical protein Tsp_10010 [Trichinella spiralis]
MKRVHRRKTNHAIKQYLRINSRKTLFKYNIINWYKPHPITVSNSMHIMTLKVDEVYLPRRGQRSGSKNSRRWRSPSRTSSGSLTPLTLYVATARSKCTNTRATTVVPNGTHESLARSSFLALRLGSSTLPNSTLRNTAILQPVLQTTYSKPTSRNQRVLLYNYRTTDAYTHRRISLYPCICMSGAARFLALYIGPGSAAPRSTQTRTTNRQLARGGSARYLRRRSKALSVFNYVVMLRIS